MSANIDRSLGEIISSRKTSTRGRRIGRRGGAKAPAGGITKTVTTKVITTKAPVRGGKQAAATATATAAKGNRKIMVSGLPGDVNEQQIKDYFGNRVGPIQRVELSYGPNGISRGVATIIFRSDLAQRAVSEHNGVKVDGKPMRVEIVYDAAHLPPAAPAKSLSDRVAESKKDKAKKDGPRKVERDGKGAGETKAGAAKRGRNAGRPRPKKKTQDELDADMTDYFGSNQAAASGSAPAAPAAAPAATAAPAAADAMDEVL